MTVALESYEEHLQQKGNKLRSIVNTIARLRGWFLDAKQAVATITPSQVRRVYEQRCAKGVSADTHRNELAEVRTWCRWLLARGWLLADPTVGLQGVGRRRRGKAKLREMEARILGEWCLSCALTPAPRADDHTAAAGETRRDRELGLAVGLVLLLGVRAGELLERVARDVDASPGRVVLWIPDSKTEAGRRRLVVPEPLATLLRARAGALPSGAWLWQGESGSGHRERTWLRKGLARLCTEAGVPVVCPHGLRGTHATLAEEAGTAGEAVARQLGHTSHRVTEEHYLEAGTVERARGRAVMQIVGGGG